MSNKAMQRTAKAAADGKRSVYGRNTMISPGRDIPQNTTFSLAAALICFCGMQWCAFGEDSKRERR